MQNACSIWLAISDVHGPPGRVASPGRTRTGRPRDSRSSSAGSRPRLGISVDEFWAANRAAARLVESQEPEQPGRGRA